MTPVDVQAALDSFKSPLDVRYEDDGTWTVMSEFIYVSPRISVHIPVGFSTDFASIPRLFWFVIAPTDHDIGKPAVVHDYLYRTLRLNVTRQFADQELREAMNCVGAPDWKQRLVYRGVRLGGWVPWNRYRREPGA